MSTKSMAWGSNKIIGDPREYQLELFEIAKTRNTIAVLGTGSGKTLIACLLIRHIIEKEYESRANGNHPRVSFFLVHNVTLVFQQAAVLRCNLDARIGEYCGNTGAGDWKKEVWDNVLKEQQVIVMTADILYSCLVHAFIKMQDINLLCFDEAHHAKKNHSFARIIRDFYIPEPENTRPKIFGMTASPVGSRADVVHAAADLEKLLHSQISTTSDLALLQGSVGRPEEVVTAYPTLKPKFRTELCQKLHKAYGELDCFSKIFAFAELASSELGPWCADMVWKFALSETQAQKLERRTERRLEAQPDAKAVMRIEKDISSLQEAAEMVRQHKIPPPSADENCLSAKALLLHAYLKEIYGVKTQDKCIIFVSRRYTASVLGELFKRLQIEYLKIGILVGSISRNGVSDSNQSLREQMITVSKFRQGKLNCLIATSVAEEGLDIPDCSLVIRFDLYQTMIQYIQSRGRARSAVSKYIHMLESGNRSHIEILSDVRNSEKIMRAFCCSLPADRILDFSGTPESSVPGNIEELHHIEPSTGAKLTMTSSMAILSCYAHRLPQEDNEPLVPLYMVRYVSEGFICEVTLPTLSPLQHIEGAPMPTKMAAKRSASFMACLELRRKNELDENFMPKPRSKRYPQMANAHLALDMHNSNVYPRKVKPDFWKIDTPLLELWFNILLLSNPAGMASEIQPICLITRNKLPPIPAFTIYSDKGVESELIVLQLSKSLRPSPDTLQKLCQFTHLLFLDLFNKTFELTLDNVPYWIAPIKGTNFTEDSLPHNTLDWKLLEEISSGANILWDNNYSVENLIGRLLIDRRKRSRRFTILGHDPTLNSTDPYPSGYECPPGILDIQDYSYNATYRRKWSAVKWKVPESEPVLIAEHLLHRINYLSAPDSKWVIADNRAVISPSAFSISAIPSRVIHMAIIFPSFITRIDSYLHAWEVCGLLGMRIDVRIGLEAITKDFDSEREHDSAHVSLQGGMGNNYERLEFLGDCFLKTATSLGLFIGHHGDDEFELHVKRMILICNKYLFTKAIEKNIPQYIQTAGFSRRTWYPEMKLLIGKGTAQHNASQQVISHRLADKSISDVCEALIGAALIDKGLDGATQMVTAILETPEHTQKVWADYYDCYTKPAYQLAEASPAQRRFAEDIEKLVKYKFKYPRLLISAFTHPSLPFSWDRIPSYQRLEFLGDAILDLVCVRYIFQKHPHADPQWLTEHKMAMVSNKFLGMVAVQMGFHRKLKRLGASLDHAIRDYEVDIQEARANSNDAMDFWTSLKSPPKALPDVLEAFLGAVFVDSGFQYSVIEGLIDTFILPYFVDMTVYDNFAGQHPTTFVTKRMTEFQCECWGFKSQQCTTGNQTYILTAIVVHREIFSHGQGTSVRNARVDASLAAMKKLEDPEGVKQLQELCNCAEVREKRLEQKAAKGKVK
ncbi:hypothetical protein L873DRAFT_1718671 [Choiromyces venosus 120613-1]|uniref:Dicer-like protein 1 n=1 Tax=Choiromyces venosus 120613-1 TaxID=1336337 RepID=A0A3N4IVK1_9PEZI|nr:hypothetical protein L873DRAFT_1718671 [Choiromyces venosus 120613-1]